MIFEYRDKQVLNILIINSLFELFIDRRDKQVLDIMIVRILKSHDKLFKILMSIYQL